MADFYAARSGTIPPLPWSSFAPPLSGCLKTDQARRMKDLEKENQRLRRAISDLTLDKLILQEAARGNF